MFFKPDRRGKQSYATEPAKFQLKSLKLRYLPDVSLQHNLDLQLKKAQRPTDVL